MVERLKDKKGYLEYMQKLEELQTGQQLSIIALFELTCDEFKFFKNFADVFKKLK